MGSVDCHYVYRPFLGAADECGDAGLIKVDHDHCFVALVDALGHGRHAHEAACLARDYLESCYRMALIPLMQGLHERLRGTPGAVASLCRLDLSSGDLTHVGIGNITVKVLGPRAMKIVSRDGIVGYRIPSAKDQEKKLYPGDILVLHSDGIRDRFNTLDCTDLLSGTAEAIANGILEKFGKRDDDASCITLRFLS